MKHRYQKVKIAVIVICVLAAGICYSCSGRQAGWESGELSVSNGGEDPETALIKADSEENAKLPGAEAAEETEGAEAGGSAGAEDTTVETTEVLLCYVHICGEVAAPGVYEMEEGSRVFQVVERAGGFTEEAASQYLNMAQTVSDGMKIVVPAMDSLKEGEQYGSSTGGGAIYPGTGTGGNGNAGVKAKVNINTASKEELMTLKGIGESKADDIIAYRESHGGFQKIEDIMKISGIKNAAFDKIKDDITV